MFFSSTVVLVNKNIRTLCQPYVNNKYGGKILLVAGSLVFRHNNKFRVNPVAEFSAAVELLEIDRDRLTRTLTLTEKLKYTI